MRTIDSLLALARLTVSEEEKTHYQNDIDAMLAMMDHMKKIDVSAHDPLYSPLDTTMLAVTDDATALEQQRDQLQKLSKATRDHLYLVPKVLP